MKKKIVVGVVAVVVLVASAYFTLPLLNPRCRDWYHRVDFIADRRVADHYGVKLGELPKGETRERYLEVLDETRAGVINEVGAKPFYCN